MALAKKNGRKSTITQNQPSSGLVMGVRPVMEMTEDTPQYYVNHLDISSNQHEFCLTFGRMTSRVTPEELSILTETHIIKLNADVQIIIPPTLIVGLLRTLTIQKELYEKMNDVQLKELGAPNNG